MLSFALLSSLVCCHIDRILFEAMIRGPKLQFSFFFKDVNRIPYPIINNRFWLHDVFIIMAAFFAPYNPVMKSRKKITKL